MIRCPACQEENPAKFRLCGYCGTPLAAAGPAPLPARELRKTVTIVFSDLKGSTSLGETLDAEALHEVKERYFSAMAAQIARHGGKIEKYIGDAIMAVFGLPRAHEDDALRAVRAALHMQEALGKVNAELQLRFGVSLANRTGVNTGEVVTSDDGTQEQKLATGDAVNLAARLEQAAPENGILIGEATWQLVRDAVELEPVGEIMVKGKAQGQRAWLLLAAKGREGVARRHDLPLVGREAELAALWRVYDEVEEERRPRLVTLIGEAGVGKTRFVQEAMHSVAADARWVAGRCLPYGDGITFWPLSLMLREAASIDDDEPPQEALERLRLMIDIPGAADRLASVTGLLEESFPLHEVYWAARCVMQRMAQPQPLVVLVDDLQWAEPAFLDLLLHVLRQAEDAPILLLCAARPELIEERPDWGQGAGCLRLRLDPLPAAAVAEVVRQRLGEATLPDATLQRLVEAAGGNPLYAEQFLSMWRESGKEAQRLDMPPSIHALLEERLDRLPRSERATVEPAAVIGMEFEQTALEALVAAPLRAELTATLQGLQRRQFLAGERGGSDPLYRFHHHLVREAVYGGLLKRTRAQLHLQFVAWAEQAYAARALEMDEILGYHLEEAHRCLRELGPLDAQGQATALAAAERLSRAARRVFARGDMHAAVNLFGRAAALLPEHGEAHLALLPDLAEAYLERGEFAQAAALLDKALAAAPGERIAASLQLLRLRVRLFSEPGDWASQALALAERCIPVFEREQAHAELARAWRLIGFQHGVAGRYGLSTEAVQRSTEHARAAGDERLVARNAMGLALSTLHGPTPVPEAIAICEDLRAGGLVDRQAEGKLLCALAQLRAMNGEAETARELVRQGRKLLRDLGQGVRVAATAVDLLLVELLAGDLVAAEREVLADYAFLQQAGESYHRPTLAALLARVLRDQGRDAEAMRYTEVAEAGAAPDDVDAQSRWRAARAPLLARAGRIDEALEMARQALDWSRRSDAPSLQGDALAQLAAVQALAGDADGAATSRAEALRLLGDKGDRVSVARLHQFS